MEINSVRQQTKNHIFICLSAQPSFVNLSETDNNCETYVSLLRRPYDS